MYSYFSFKKIEINENVLDITQGVPQGFILGSTLRNILFNPILNITIPRGGFTLTYADDLALIVMAKDKQNLIENGKEALEEINY